ncbi:hypothetical protein [Curtobacterium luteum]|uniref:hypothetical protein n=1 Tax=Curtobacterium luteum TaxID=33881 RepID=UPI0038022DEE
MALFRMDDDQLVEQESTSFRHLNLRERSDIQRLLRVQPEALGEELLIVSEEFGNWEDSRRRIDLLALDESGSLVVIELKRTDDGGHMELQALRYAAMISSMTFDEVVDAHAAFRARLGDESASPQNSRAAISDFLGTDGEDIALTTNVRIILVSADFGREITTAVLWLNRFEGMDIRCVRLRPYEIDNRVFVDIDQVLPLPEAADYQIRIGRKEAARARQSSVSDGRDFTKYVIISPAGESPELNKRNAVRQMVSVMTDNGVSIQRIRALFRERIFRTVPGTVAPGDATAQALLDREPRLDVKRYFVESPIHEGGETHVMFRMWGRNTESSLDALVAAFPEVGARYRAVRQEPSDS